MVEAQQNEVNGFGVATLPEESPLALRVRTLTCLLHLGRLIEQEDRIESVGQQVPDALAEGLISPNLVGVRLVLGGKTFSSTGFIPSSRVYRKKILSRQHPVGEIEIHLTEDSGPLRPEQWDMLAAVAERLSRFHERKTLQSALEHSEHRYQQLFRQARDGIVLVDADTDMILDANESFLDLAGQPIESLQSSKVYEILDPADCAQFRADVERVIEEQERHWVSQPIVTTTRQNRQIEVTCSVVHFTERNVLQFICRDITERQTLADRLAESETCYRAIFDSTPVAMITCDARGMVLDVNVVLLSKFLSDAFSKDALIGKHVLELGLFDLGGRQVDFMQFLRGLCVQLPDVPILESPYRSAGYANIRCIPLQDAHGKVLFGLILIEDITEVREAQRAMVQSAKMAAVGQMTMGFAHELGTPLGIISANAQYLLKDWEGKPGADELHVILHEIHCITNLIQKLLIFSRSAAFKPAPASVNDVLREVIAMMQPQEILRQVEVVADLAPDLPLIPLDVTLIKQVFFNLIINAGQAMPDGGRLTIASRSVRSIAGSRRRGPFAEIAVSDTGMGISPADLRKIFIPFFTTKDVGKGTGLGLSVSYRIVQNHGGVIVAESRGERQGATFRVFLPMSSPEGNPLETAGDWNEPPRAEGGKTHGR